MGELQKLKNIGKNAEELLNRVGITTCEQLTELGSRQAWLKIKAIDDSVCIMQLYDLEGAVRGIPKKELPPEIKAELKDFYNHFKG